MRSGRRYEYPASEAVYQAVTGYAKSLRQEQPKLRLKTVGIDGTPVDHLAELSNDRLEIRYLAGQREVLTLEELSARPNTETPLRRGGVYIITGGAGGLGPVGSGSCAFWRAQPSDDRFEQLRRQIDRKLGEREV